MTFKEWMYRGGFAPPAKPLPDEIWESATLAERERCAKVCDDRAKKLIFGKACDEAHYLSQAIRKGDK